MKNYKEMADSVFKRSNEIINNNRNRRRKITKAISLSAVFCCCVAVLFAVGNIKNDKNEFVADVSNQTEKENGTSISESQSEDSSHIVSGIINNTSPKESSVEQNPDITAEDSHLCSSNDNVDASGGGPEAFQRYYPDELFGLYKLSKLVTWDEIYAAEKTLLENNEYFYNEQLPSLYLMIKELDISKEDFVRVNNYFKDFNKKHGTEQPVCTDKQIEMMFGDYDIKTIQTELKLDTAFFYKERLYNIYELAALEPIQLKEMVDEGNMIDYLNVLESISAEEDSKILNNYIDFIKNKIDK